MSRRLAVGVVGLRFGSQVHVPAFRSDDRCEVVALAARESSTARDVARDCGLTGSHTDWRALVAAPEIDIVSIAVPPEAQPAIVAEAVRYRKHVFCEKPLAPSVSEARHMLTAVQAAGVVHGIDFIFPEIAAWQRAKSLLTDGAIGRLVHFAYAWRVETYASRTNATSWKTHQDRGGGALGNFVSHVFYNIEWLLGGITALDGFVCSRTGRAVDGVVRLENGSTGTISVSTDAFLGCGHRIEIHGEQGTLVLHNPTSDYASGFSLSMGTRSSPTLASVFADADAPVGDGRLGATSRLVRRFVDAVQGGAEMTPNLTHGVRVQELLAMVP